MTAERENPNDCWIVRLAATQSLFVTEKTAMEIAQAVEIERDRTLAVRLTNGGRAIVVLAHVEYVREYTRAVRRVESRMDAIDDREREDDTKDMIADEDEPWKAR
jgi:hypothetical protein